MPILQGAYCKENQRKAKQMKQTSKSVLTPAYQCDGCGTVFSEEYLCREHEPACIEWHSGNARLKAGDYVQSKDNASLSRIAKVEKDDNAKCFRYQLKKVQWLTPEHRVTLNDIVFYADGKAVEKKLRLAKALMKKYRELSGDDVELKCDVWPGINFNVEIVIYATFNVQGERA